MLIAGALLVAAVLAAAQGDVEVTGAHPAWARACVGGHPRPDRQLLARCARVRGRVLWSQRRSTDLHVAVLAAFHVFVVKLPEGSSPPSLGDAIAVVGPLVRARIGFRELEAWSVQRP